MYLKKEVYRELVDQSAVGILIIQDGKVVFANSVLARWLGISTARIKKTGPLEWIRHDHRGKIKKRIETLRQGKTGSMPLIHEFAALRADGEALWLRGHMSTLELNGRPALVHSMVDITRWKEAIERWKEREDLFLKLGESAKDAIIMMDEQGRTTYWNEEAARMFGYEKEEIIGRETHRMLATENLFDRYRKAFPRFQESGRGEVVGRTIELEAKHKNGGTFPIELSLSAFRVGSEWHSLAIVRDISARRKRETMLAEQEQRLKKMVDRKTRSLQQEIAERKRKEQLLQDSEEKYRTFFERVPLGMYRTTPDGRFIDANPALVKMLKVQSRQKLLQARVTDYFVYHEDRRLEQSLLHEDSILTAFDTQLRCADGTVIWVRDNARVITDDDGTVMYYEGILEDITVQKEAEQQLMELSIRDPLTGAFNRRHILERLEEMIEKHKRDRSLFSVAILDIDHFKKINDNYGHLAGDMILREFTAALRKNIRAYDLFGRFGGEEFIIIFIGISKHRAARITRRILEKISKKKFSYNDNVIRFTFSGGIADITRFPHDKKMVDAVLARADHRLYHAKETGRNRIVIETPAAEEEATQERCKGKE